MRNPEVRESPLRKLYPAAPRSSSLEGCSPKKDIPLAIEFNKKYPVSTIVNANRSVDAAILRRRCR